jgi:uncharacterized membrane protein YqjE
MALNEPPAGGVFESLRRLGVNGLALMRNRLELFSVELQIEEARLIKLLVLAAVGVLLANMAVLMGTAVIIILADGKVRVPVLVGLFLFYALAATAIFFALRRHLRSTTPPFNETLSEVKKDCEWLTSRK